MRTVKIEINCNKLTCGRCWWQDCGQCTLFLGVPRELLPDKNWRKAEYLRCPECLAADTDLEICEGCGKRTATHTDCDGVGLCGTCWAALCKEAKEAE